MQKSRGGLTFSSSGVVAGNVGSQTSESQYATLVEGLGCRV